jgi:transcription antitermination protein NusB
MSEPPNTTGASGGRRRTAARLAAVQALYQLELVGGSVDTIITEFLQHRFGRQGDTETVGEAEPTFFAELTRGASERLVDLDRTISTVLTPDWPLGRLESVLRAILRMGAYELLVRVDVPATVIISEYLDIAHAFFDGKEPGLVNGVLDRLAHRFRPEEMTEGKHGGDLASG